MSKLRFEEGEVFSGRIVLWMGGSSWGLLCTGRAPLCSGMDKKMNKRRRDYDNLIRRSQMPASLPTIANLESPLLIAESFACWICPLLV
jgi:hypothetical protein